MSSSSREARRPFDYIHVPIATTDLDLHLQPFHNDLPSSTVAMQPLPDHPAYSSPACLCFLRARSFIEIRAWLIYLLTFVLDEASFCHLILDSSSDRESLMRMASFMLLAGIRRTHASFW